MDGRRFGSVRIDRRTSAVWHTAEAFCGGVIMMDSGNAIELRNYRGILWRSYNDGFWECDRSEECKKKV